MKAKLVSFEELNKFLEDKDFVEKIEQIKEDYFVVWWHERKVWECDTSQLSDKEKIQFGQFLHKLKWSNP